MEELVDMGAYMQINADSIIGKNGLSTKNYCRKIMRGFQLRFKKMGIDYANQIFINNPQKILEDGKRRKEK